MINYIVRPSPFYPGIFSGMSPFVGSAEGPPVRLAWGHFASSIHRCPRGHAEMKGMVPVAGSVGCGGCLLFRLAVRGKLGLMRLAFLLLGPGLTEWQLFTLILTIRIQIWKTLISHVTCHMWHVKWLCWSSGHAEQLLFSDNPQAKNDCFPNFITLFSFDESLNLTKIVKLIFLNTVKS